LLFRNIFQKNFFLLSVTHAAFFVYFRKQMKASAAAGEGAESLAARHGRDGLAVRRHSARESRPAETR
jgi:hypothetical protein